MSAQGQAAGAVEPISEKNSSEAASLDPVVQQAFQQMLDVVAQQVDPQPFKIWFNSLRPGKITPDSVILKTHTEYSRQWLKEYYTPIIEKACQDVFGNHITWSIEVDDTINPQVIAPKTAAPSHPEPPRHEVRVSPDQPHQKLVLNPDYSFENFVVGDSNRLAHAYGQAVVNNKEITYNPLFIHGSVGLGKTHLLTSICHSLLDTTPDMAILFISCETFVNSFISSIQTGNLEKFRKTHREIDLLIIDDIHFLAGKESSQDEFFHTFNSLVEKKKQIIISSDAEPKEIPSLEERLVSRFCGGAIAMIDKPTFETRVAILRQKAKDRAMDINNDVLMYVAEHINSNIRELEGAIIKLVGISKLTNKTIDMDLAVGAFPEFAQRRERNVTIDDILEIVTEDFQVRLADIQSKSRAQSITLPRQVGMFLAREMTSLSWEEIGARFGGRDHSTTIYGYNKVKEKIDNDHDLALMVNRLEQKILQKVKS